MYYNAKEKKYVAVVADGGMMAVSLIPFGKVGAKIGEGILELGGKLFRVGGKATAVVATIAQKQKERFTNALENAKKNNVINNDFTQNRKFWSKDPVNFNGNKVYQRNDLFDPNQVSTWTDKGKVVTGNNLDRMSSGRAPIGSDGNSVNLHHMTQTQNGAIAEVTQTFHQKNTGVIHINSGSNIPSGINRSEFNTWSKTYWKTRANNWSN